MAQRSVAELCDFLEQAFVHSPSQPELPVFLAARDALLTREVDSDAERERLVHALVLAASACFIATAPRDGLRALERADAEVARLPDGKLKCRLFNLKASLHLVLGDFTQSFEAYVRTAEIARRLNERDVLGRAIANLSALFIDFGAYWDGLKLGERVLAMHASAPLASNVLVVALNNMGSACLSTQQVERGIELASRAVQESPHERALDRQHLCTAHVLLARLHLLRGRPDAAERALSAARATEHEGAGPSRASLMVAVAAALIEHERGRLRPAIQALKALLLRANADPTTIRDVLWALVTVYEKEGRPASALKYLQRLSAMSEPVNFDHARQRLIGLGLLDADAWDSSLSAAGLLAECDLRLQTARLGRHMIDAQLEILERVAVAAEMRDDITGLHCYRVGKWAQLVARELGLTPTEADSIEIAARLHDIGKIGIPDELLRKPARLTPEEFEIMQRHTVLGARLLSGSKSAQIRLAEQVALTHHEHWDGSGYPRGIAQTDIPLAGRITAVVDVFDALTHVRPYKKAWTIDAALTEIRRLDGHWFDPAVVAAFERVFATLFRLDPAIDPQIERRLKHSRILRLRDYVVTDIP